MGPVHMRSDTFYPVPLPHIALPAASGEPREGLKDSEVNETRLRCVLKCLLGLSEEEAYVLAHLLLDPRPATAKDIAASSGRNQEVVRRALRKLYSKGLITRRPFPLRRGGRAYIYEPRPDLVEKLRELCKAAQHVVELMSQAAANKSGSSGGA